MSILVELNPHALHSTSADTRVADPDAGRSGLTPAEAETYYRLATGSVAHLHRRTATRAYLGERPIRVLEVVRIGDVDARGDSRRLNAATYPDPFGVPDADVAVMIDSHAQKRRQ